MSRRKFDTRGWGTQLRTMRKEAGLTIAAVAEILHVHCNTIVGWEMGKRAPTLTDFDAYLKAVGGSIVFGTVDEGP